MKCPQCGGRVPTSKSMLGGKLVAWHKPKRAKAPTFAKGQCLYSGTVINESKRI